MASKQYDFIVVGAGAGGCTVAWRLANAKKAPSVLLVEAGGQNNILKADSEKWIHRMNAEENWGYNTIPQKNVDNLVIAYDRGRGLGGSTAINFSAWNIGPRDDADVIAALTGDEEWNWENAKKRYNRLENYHGWAPEIPEGYEAYLKPKREDHGTDGPLHVGFPTTWEAGCKEMMDIWKDSGYDINLDQETGNPLGLAVSPTTAWKGLRSTAKDLIKDAPKNLEIATDSPVARVLFDGKKAVGVKTLDGTTYNASKEIILSAGALDTPKILMHSGVGPADQLEKFDIPIVHASPAVGQGLRDHCHVVSTWTRSNAAGTNARAEFYNDPAAMAEAQKQWDLDHTGPLAEINTLVGMGYFKSKAVLESAEFEALPEDVKQRLQAPTVPSYELLVNGPAADHYTQPGLPALASLFIFLMNPQSVGSVTLQSKDPNAPLLFDPNFFDHPYDKRVVLEATREVLNVVGGPAFQKETTGVLDAPESTSDEDIWNYWKTHVASTWHMSGTVKIGKEGDNTAAADKNFKVLGVSGLRVADMSVVPIMANNHTQTTAYLTGLIAGDRLVDEYGLDA